MTLRRFALVIIAILVLIGLAHTALAASLCGEKAAVEADLASKYGERPQSTGDMPNGTSMTIWANRDTGTWTAVVTTPDGRACIPAAGQGYEDAGAPNI